MLLRIWGIIRCGLSMQVVHLCWKTSFVPLMRCAFKINFKLVFLNLPSRSGLESKSVVADMFICVFSNAGCRHMHLSHNPILWNNYFNFWSYYFNMFLMSHRQLFLMSKCLYTKSSGTYLLLHLRCKILQPHQPFHLYLSDLIIEWDCRIVELYGSCLKHWHILWDMVAAGFMAIQFVIKTLP